MKEKEPVKRTYNVLYVTKYLSENRRIFHLPVGGVVEVWTTENCGVAYSWARFVPEQRRGIFRDPDFMRPIEGAVNGVRGGLEGRVVTICMTTQTEVILALYTDAPTSPDVDMEAIRKEVREGTRRSISY